MAVKKTHQSIQVLNTLLSSGCDYGDVYFLLATAYVAEKNLEKVIEHGEKALDLDDGTFEKRKLHLHLFNAYLELSKKRNEEKLEDVAANHLYAIIDEMQVSLENRLWLANHFVKKSQCSQDDRVAERAISILEPLLLNDLDFHRFEREAVSLVSLYHALGTHQKERMLLKKLEELHAQEGAWKYIEETTLAFADYYAAMQENDEAKKIYYTLSASTNLKVAYAARLKWSRLSFFENPNGALQTLRELIARKDPMYEPLHLEAAIDYAEFSALLVNENQRIYKLVDLLHDAKIEFTNQDDIASKDYHEGLCHSPEKEKIYEAYMRYLDARIYQLQGRIAKHEGHHVEGNTKDRAAFALFSSLRQGKYAVTRYIKDKAAVAMK